MIVHRICNCKYARSLTGVGAYQYGGRWNSPGQYMLYSSMHSSMALLEILAHFSPHQAPEQFCIVNIELPDACVLQLNEKTLPENWDAYPSPIALRQIGDRFLQSMKALALKVPSAIVPYEYNILINPLHPDFGQVKLIDQRVFEIDKRIIPKD
jgi:RES domain-containing protein